MVAGLKRVYTAVTLDEARENLRHLSETWHKQYPSCVRSWEDNWEILSTFFEYPMDIRKIIYTTNIIEGLNRQFRQSTKNKPSFTDDDSLRSLLYLVSQRIVKHWHARCQNWDMVLSLLQIFYSQIEQRADPLAIGFPGGWNGIHAVPARIPFHPPGDDSGQGVSPIMNIKTVIFLRLAKIAYTKFSAVPCAVWWKPSGTTTLPVFWSVLGCGM